MELNLSQMKAFAELMDNNYAANSDILIEAKEKIAKHLMIERSKFELNRNTCSQAMYSMFNSIKNTHEFEDNIVSPSQDPNDSVYNSLKTPDVGWGTSEWKSPIKISNLTCNQPGERYTTTDKAFEKINIDGRLSRADFKFTVSLETGKLENLNDCDDINMLKDILKDCVSLSNKIKEFKTNLKQKENDV